MNTNNDINNYITNNYNNYNRLEEEIEDIFNNLLEEQCYVYYNSSLVSNKLIGIDENINLGDFTFLIPNLFRACYSKKSISLPSVCPTYIDSTNYINYFPILINTDLIKSFLYFNFPGSIKNYNDDFNFIKTIFQLKNIQNIKKSTNYNESTNPLEIISKVYSTDSLLIQLLNFNNYLNASNFADSENLLINYFNIFWDFTKECISYTNNISDSYIISNTGNKVIINENGGNNLYIIKYSQLNYFKNTIGYINSNKLIYIQKNSIFTILDIVSQVYQDISNELLYYLNNKEYCKKSYMYTYNIPVLLKIYKNYYNNQIYTLSKSLVQQSIYNIIPNVITIQEYVNSFKITYSNSNPVNKYLQKEIYLISGIEALLFYTNFENTYVTQNRTPTYTYYYININNPSPIKLVNSNYNLNLYYYHDTVNDFTTFFNQQYVNDTYIVELNHEYPKQALFPLGGTGLNTLFYTYPNPGFFPPNITLEYYNIPGTISGFEYFIYDNNLLKYCIYETLYSYIDTDSMGKNISGQYQLDQGVPSNLGIARGAGLALIYYQNI